MAIAPEPIIQLMNNMKAPYNINKLTADVASKALDDLTLYRRNIMELMKEKEFLMQELRNFPAIEKIFPSDANFILFRIAKSKEIYKTMADEGIVCRYRGTEPHCDSCLRVTIGTHEENVKFISLLKQVAESKGVN
jgi:histidinol-phosphate aminotransferase